MIAKSQVEKLWNGIKGLSAPVTKIVETFTDKVADVVERTQSLVHEKQADGKYGWGIRNITRTVRRRVHDGVQMLVMRRDRRGRPYVQDSIRFGTNHVHAFITHADHSITDLGLSTNLLTNIGRDVWADWTGGRLYTQNGPATATSATTFTGTGATWTASNLATPQLGLAGARAYFPVTGLTTAPVYGNIASNTTSVATVDQWWDFDDGAAATTPAATNAFIIGAGGISSVRFMALTTDASAASATNTALTTEITTNGAGRALATYAHTYGASTLTLQKAYSITGTLTAIHRMGLFCSLTASTGPLIFESVMNADATVVNGDTLTCLSGNTYIRTRDGCKKLRDLVGSELEVLNKFGVWEKATVRSFGTQRLHRVEFAGLGEILATADHRWWQSDGSRVTTTDLKRVPFVEDMNSNAEVKSVTDTGHDEEVFCAVVPGSESFTLDNGLVTSNCTDTVTLSYV